MKKIKSDVLENIDALVTTDDNGAVKFTQLYPHTGYVLRIEANDLTEQDEEGNDVVDENGNPIVIPYRTMGGAITPRDYDFEKNSMGYAAEEYTDDMELF